ncbi:LacI family transcriptional regulator [Crossiella equi]|uniref:LacI family transcriptional regulator n=1 Tax=Crossiella equi TaxID=130796 RepID=A0ABS5AQ91_9PSEU|nr:LacI family DNA-binding transcriptional regulator [Crossiella equi]MBP2478738.1 LacI family transcriptional regulator [Crossiella equi]
MRQRGTTGAAATIRDVARQAQVSVATVSRALSSPNLVREQTRERVLSAAAALGYQPNRAARGLITGRTGNLGIVVPDLDNPFFTGVLKAVQHAAGQADHSVFVADSDEDPVVEEKLVRTMAQQVDGLIVCAPGLPDEPLLKVAASTRLVLVNRELPGTPAALMNAGDGIRQLVEHLAGLGHRRVAFLSGPDTSWSNQQRRQGLRSSAPEHGLEVVELGPFPPRYEGGVAAADLLLAQQGITATIAYNDVMALGVLARLREHGVRVPEDMSLTGYDDLVFAGLCQPALTTVAMPVALAGRLAVEMLLNPPEADEAPDQPRREWLPTRLVERATTAPPAPAAR